MPSFELHGLSRTENTFWRDYSLKSPGVNCRLLEVFPCNLDDENRICSPQEAIERKVKMSYQDKIAWVNSVPEVK